MKPINLPQDFATGYDKRLSVMLYQYLRDVSRSVGDANDAATLARMEASRALVSRVDRRTDDSQSILANQVFGY